MKRNLNPHKLLIINQNIQYYKKDLNLNQDFSNINNKVKIAQMKMRTLKTIKTRDLGQVFCLKFLEFLTKILFAIE